MKANLVIGLLADGQVHSGESLANQLAVSRTAVWKQVRKAMEQGYRIETIRGKGYRMLTRVDLLSRNAVLERLDSNLRQRVDLSVLDEVDSTNAEVIRRQAEISPGTIPVCIADCQTAGRGRRGRPWRSPRGENIYISFGLTFPGGFAMLDGLSLVFGVAIAEALEVAGAQDIGLKWPNDLYCSGRKLGGILVELQGELEEGVVRVIVGVGLNVHMTAAPDVDQPWTSLARELEGQDWQRNALASALVTSVVGAADEFSASGFSPFRERWQGRDIFSGRQLAAKQGEVAGTGRGIDDQGNYLIESTDGVEAVRAGEISLRVAAP